MDKSDKILTAMVVILGIVATLFFGVLITKILTDDPISESSYSTVIEDERPDYDYLKSITVKVVGCKRVCPSVGGYSDEDEYGEGQEEEGLILFSDECTDVGCWKGTGVIVKVDRTYTYVLTNAHVAGMEEDEKSLYISTEDKDIEAEVVKYHSSLDLAVIKVRGKLEDKQAVNGFSSVVRQDKVYLVGNPLSNNYLYGEGVVAGYQGPYDVYQLPIAPGNSGSGVVNQEGELVGVCFAVQSYGGLFSRTHVITHALAINGLSIELFLKQLKLI